MPTPSIGPAGDRETLGWLGGARVRVVLPAAACAGRLSVMEIEADTGYVAAGHTHDREDELFYVLAGALTVWAGDWRGRVLACDRAYLPRGSSHGYRVDAGPARLLTVCTPGGLDGFFDEVAAELRRNQGAPAEPTLRAIGARYGVTYD